MCVRARGVVSHWSRKDDGRRRGRAVVDANRARDRAEQETDSLRKKHERLRSFTDEQATAVTEVRLPTLSFGRKEFRKSIAV